MKLTKENIQVMLAFAKEQVTFYGARIFLCEDLLEARAEVEKLRTFQREAILESARLRAELDDFADREKGSADESDEGKG